MGNVKFFSILLIATGLVFTSCKKYYEQPINNYLQQELNDPSSYSMMEYKVITDSNFYECFKPLQSYSNKFTYQDLPRIRDLYDYLDYWLKYFDCTKYTFITISSRDIMLNRINNNLDSARYFCNRHHSLEYFKYYNYLEKALSEIRTLINAYSECIVYNTSLGDAFNHHMQITVDYNNYIKGLYYPKISNRTSVNDSIVSFIKNGRIIYHKYRAKNEMGAIVIQEKIFVLSKDKKTVVEIIDAVN